MVSYCIVWYNTPCRTPRQTLRPLTQSPGFELRLGLLAWAGAVTPVLWRPSCQEEEEEAQARIQYFLNAWGLFSGWGAEK